MAAITNPKTRVTELAGNDKILAFDSLAIASASETLTLTLADNGASTILAVVASPSAGVDAAYSYLEASFSGLVITIKSFAQAGGVATDFTGTKANLIVVCSS